MNKLKFFKNTQIKLKKKKDKKEEFLWLRYFMQK